MPSRLPLAAIATILLLGNDSALAQQADPGSAPASPAAAPSATIPTSPSPTAPATTTAATVTPGSSLPPVVVTQDKPKTAAPTAKPPAPRQQKLQPSLAKAEAKPPKPEPAAKPTKPAASATAAAPPSAPPTTAPLATGDAALTPPAGVVLMVGDGYAGTVGAAGTDVAASSGANVADVLADKPGVGGSTFAPGANRPILRGLDNNRVLVTENGLGSGDVSALSEDHAVPIDPCALDRVDVLHGPATLRYGGAAIGGVVAAESEIVPTRVPAGGVSGEVRGGLTSVDDGREGCFKTSAGSRGFVVHASGFERHAKDYRTPDGVQQNTFVDSSGHSIGGSYVWADGFLGAAYSRFSSLYGIPGIEAAESKDRIDMNQEKISARGEWRPRDFGVAAIKAWFGYSDYAHSEVLFDADAGADAVGSRFLDKEYEGRLEIEHLPLMTSLGRLTGTVGLHVLSRDMSGLSFEGDNLLEPNHTRKVAVYLFEELQVTKPLRLLASARYEQAKVDGAFHADISAPDGTLVALSREFELLSGSLGARYELPFGITTRASATYVERAPEAQELFSKGAHEATGTFEIGDPTLHKESAVTFEIGLERERGPLRFDAAAFLSRYQGYIFRQLTGDTCGASIDTCIVGEGEELKKAIFGQRDATFYGAELSGEVDIAPVWRGVWGISGRYDFVHARFEGGDNVPRIPPHRLGGGVFYRDHALRAHIGLLHAFRQNDVGVNETATSGYDLLSAEVTYTFRLDPVGPVRPEFVLGLKGENLLDDDVRNHASFKKDEVLQPGQSVRAFGIVRF